MIFRKICNDTSTMSATELAHNFVFVKNREAWYRDFDREIPVRDLMREICAKHAAPADTDELTDEELDEILYDNLQFGTDDLEGVFAILYMALYGMTDVRAWLESKIISEGSIPYFEGLSDDEFHTMKYGAKLSEFSDTEIAEEFNRRLDSPFHKIKLKGQAYIGK